MRMVKYIILPLALYSFPAYGGCAAKNNVLDQGNKLVQVLELFVKNVESGLLPESNQIKNSIKECCISAYDLCENTETNDEFIYILKENKQLCKNMQVVTFMSDKEYILYVYCVELSPFRFLAAYKKVKGKQLKIVQ